LIFHEEKWTRNAEKGKIVDKKKRKTREKEKKNLSAPSGYDSPPHARGTHEISTKATNVLSLLLLPHPLLPDQSQFF
jgi:hypothetical protein